MTVIDFQAKLIREYVGPETWQMAAEVVQADIDQNYREKHASKETEVLCRIPIFKQSNFDRKMLTSTKLWHFNWDTVVIYSYLQDTKGLDPNKKAARQRYLMNIFFGQE